NERRATHQSGCVARTQPLDGQRRDDEVDQGEVDSRDVPGANPQAERDGHTASEGSRPRRLGGPPVALASQHVDDERQKAECNEQWYRRNAEGGGRPSYDRKPVHWSPPRCFIRRSTVEGRDAAGRERADGIGALGKLRLCVQPLPQRKLYEIELFLKRDREI